MLVGLIQVIFTGIAALIMDKAGRKVLLIISGIFSRPQLIFYYYCFCVSSLVHHGELDTVILFLIEVLP